MLLAALLCACGHTVTITDFAIVPEPVSVEMGQGSYAIKRSVELAVSGLGQNSPTAKYIMNSLRQAHLHPSLVSLSDKSDIELVVNDTIDSELGNEGYRIEVSATGVRLSANTETGLLYAYQSFVQMVPPDVLDRTYRTIVLPECTVVDYPRFEWRGAHLDACSHYMPVKVVKRYLDAMGSFKLNRFHWQLVDSNAWRLPCQPLWTADSSAPRYTSEEIADVVSYAAALGIEVIPGIEIPLVDSLISDTNALNAVAVTVTSLFPSSYIHMGHPIAAYSRWAAVDSALAARERTPMLWVGDKAYEHGRKAPFFFGLRTVATALDPAVGTSMASIGLQVVMCPSDFCALDRYQADPRYQPQANDGLLTLAQTYGFDPVPKEANLFVARNIIGGQCILATTHITNQQEAEYMLLPRLLAISECLWSQPAAKNWNRFRKKVETLKIRLASKGYAYCEGSFKPIFRATRVDNHVTNIAIETEVPNTYIFYTTDMSTPTRNSPVYIGPINLARNTHIKILPVYKDHERDSVYEYIIK
jgi:hexosaminidase